MSYKVKANAAVAEMVGYMNEIKDRMLASTGEIRVVVTGITFNTKVVKENGQQVRVLNPDRYSRVGFVHVQLPRGYAEIRYYNRNDRVTEWHEFGDYMLDVRRPSFLPRPGSGQLTLAIRVTEEGTLRVNNPVKPYKDGFIDLIRTKDIRFGRSHSDNNHNLTAALSAFVNVYAGTFTRHNPENRHGIGEHCGNCKFNAWIGRYDGLEEDYDNKYSDQGIIASSQFGQMVPQQVCIIHKEFTDFEAVMEANAAMEHEKDYAYDDRKGQDGQEIGYRRLAPNEVVIGGKIKRTFQIRREGTAETCAECPFYHKFERKDEKKLGIEKAEANGEYVSEWWSERPQWDRMPIFTQGKHKGVEGWHLGFPGEIDEPYAFMVMGIGGVAVYGVNEIMGDCDPDFVPSMEEYQANDAYAAKVCNYVYEFCRNFHAMTDNDLEQLDALLAEKPEGLTPRMERRWDSADRYLTRTIQQYAK